MNIRIPALAVLLVAGGSAAALAQMSPAPMAPAPAPVSFKLAAQNGSGETGTATLTQDGANVIVVVKTTGFPADPQPIHIHDGTCAKLDPKPTYPLTTMVAGSSMTTLKDMKLATLTTGGFAINIHHSTSDIPTYYACGDIPKAK